MFLHNEKISLPIGADYITYIIKDAPDEIISLFRKYFKEGNRRTPAHQKCIILSFLKSAIDNRLEIHSSVKCSGIYPDAGFQIRALKYSIVFHKEREARIFYETTAEIHKYKIFDSVFRTLISCEVLQRGGITIHASSAVKNGRSYVFTAPSGGGKSTIIKKFPNDGILSEDFTVIKPGSDQSGYFLSGALNSWTETLPCREESYPVHAIYVIRKSKDLAVMECSKSDAVKHLIQNSIFFMDDMESRKRILNNVLGIAKNLPCRYLYFNLTDDIWNLI
jgi:hypothetical protein